MRLQAQAPTRVRQTIAQRGLRVGIAAGAIHRLQKEVTEGERLEGGRINAGLRVDQLELVAGVLFELCAGLGADADPVETGRRGDSAVGFNGNLKATCVKSVDKRSIELEQRLTTGANDESVR